MKRGGDFIRCPVGDRLLARRDAYIEAQFPRGRADNPFHEIVEDVVVPGNAKLAVFKGYDVYDLVSIRAPTERQTGCGKIVAGLALEREEFPRSVR